METAVATSLEFPTTPEEVERLLAAAIARANERIDAALAGHQAEGPSFDELFGSLDDAARDVARTYGETGFLAAVAEDDALRDAGEAAREAIDGWRAGLPLRTDLAAAINRFAETANLAALDPEELALVRRWQADVRLGGAALPPEQREDAARLTGRLNELSSAYLHAFLTVDRIELTAEELDGVPESLVATYQPGSRPETFDVAVDDPTMNAILDRARRRDVRERIYRAFNNKGGPDARAALEEAVEVRRQLAAVLGYPSWQALRIENLAAPSTAWIEAFIVDMAARLGPIQATEMDAMRRTLLAEPGAPADLTLEDWDWRYADTRQRDEIGADASALEPYLQFETVWSGLAGLSETVFGVRIVPRPERTGWHPDVRGNDLVDAASGQILGHLFVDPFVRHGKAGGAFADLLDPGDRYGRSGPPRPPTLALVLNSPRPVDGVSLLSLFQVTIMFHEYGHVLDFGLSTARFAIQRPDSWLPWDWIEGPSGFLERWGGQPEVIGRYARHHRTGEVIPAALLEPLARAEAKNTAFRAMRHLSMGRLDALIHGSEPIALEAADRQAWTIRGTPYVEGISFPSTVPHLLSGYDAAIYGWVWAQALRDDLLSRFQREGMLSPVVGLEYRRAMMERSWTTDPLDAHEQFMGRPWSIDAFLDRVARGAASD